MNVEEHQNPNRRWRNRRRMAWSCLIAGILYPILFWAVDSPHLATVAGPFYMFCGTVVAVYTGASAYETCNANPKV